MTVAPSTAAGGSPGPAEQPYRAFARRSASKRAIISPVFAMAGSYSLALRASNASSRTRASASSRESAHAGAAIRPRVPARKRRARRNIILPQEPRGPLCAGAGFLHVRKLLVLLALVRWALPKG